MYAIITNPRRIYILLIINAPFLPLDWKRIFEDKYILAQTEIKSKNFSLISENKYEILIAFISAFID